VRAREVLEIVGLTEHADRPIIEYSGGMKKRLDLACGLLHHPRVLILDEPTLGLDVQARHNIWEHITALRAEGMTVLLATNYLDEADRVCDRLMIIDHGKEIVTGVPAELKHSVGGDVVEVETDGAQAFADRVQSESWVKRVAVSDGTAHVYVEDATRAMPALMRQSVDLGIDLKRVSYSGPTLDDVFLQHTGRELRESRP
jgi:ABC-2 type transport system ATP-binding protein